MKELKEMNDHELVDIKNAIEREQKRREEGVKVLTYSVISCMTEHLNFLTLKCALLAMREVSELVISSSIEDDGEYVNKCTGIVGMSFRVKEMPQEHVEAMKKEGYYHDYLYEDHLGELNDE